MQLVMDCEKSGSLTVPGSTRPFEKANPAGIAEMSKMIGTRKLRLVCAFVPATG